MCLSSCFHFLCITSGHDDTQVNRRQLQRWKHENDGTWHNHEHTALHASTMCDIFMAEFCKQWLPINPQFIHYITPIARKCIVTSTQNADRAPICIWVLHGFVSNADESNITPLYIRDECWWPSLCIVEKLYLLYTMRNAFIVHATNCLWFYMKLKHKLTVNAEIKVHVSIKRFSYTFIPKYYLWGIYK